MTDRDLTPDYDPSPTGVPGWAQMAGRPPVDPQASVAPQTRDQGGTGSTTGQAT